MSHVARFSDPVSWLHLLPRWSLLLALTALLLPLVFIVGLGQQASDNALGAAYVELLQAVRNPAMFRLAWLIDALVWLMLGVSLLVFAGALQRRAPIRAAFIAVCGLAQLFGAFGSFLRLDGISDLAIRYATTATADQTVFLEAYLSLSRVIDSANHLGVLLQGLGFLLVASCLLSLRGFPRWLAIWLVLPGILAISQFVLFITGAGYVFLLNIIGLLAGNIALNLAIAFALWRPGDELIAAVTGQIDRL